jgi:hypothetical protein
MRAALALSMLLLAASSPAPAQPAAMPDREAFLAETRKRLASNDLLQSGYAYRERVTDVRMNPLGRIGTGPIEVYDVYPIAGKTLTYKRLIERDGASVAPAVLTAADSEFLARYQEWRRAAAVEGQSERDARLLRQRIAAERDRARASEAIGLFEFALERRDTLEGQAVIVVSFKPKPDAQPRTREGRVAASFAGFAWVHEHEYQVMRVEAEAITDTSFGLGVIAKLHRGAKALFTRRRFGDVWLPVETHVTGTGRAMLFRKVTINYLRQYSDYRPFDPAELPSLLDGSTRSK